jgi:hypothetical protein
MVWCLVKKSTGTTLLLLAFILINYIDELGIMWKAAVVACVLGYYTAVVGKFDIFPLKSDQSERSCGAVTFTGLRRSQ